MRKATNVIKKIRDTKGTFDEKTGTIKDLTCDIIFVILY